MNSDTIITRVDEILATDHSRDEKLLLICELLHEEIDVFDWVGFYMASDVEDKMLILGPYVGEETDHTKIPYGTGICGQAAATMDTFVVQDVSKADNYLACSVDVKSEIVVPVMKEDEFVAELDIDSHTKDAMTPELRDLCETVAKKISTLF